MNKNSVDADIITIINLFVKNIKGVNVSLSNRNDKHCGKEGHWLEEKMQIKINRDNKPDICGFEMKKLSKKITLGDFSASEYLYSCKNKRKVINVLNELSDDIKISRNEFIHFLGILMQTRIIDILGLDIVYQHMEIGTIMVKFFW
jgi:hypothetical protein